MKKEELRPVKIGGHQNGFFHKWFVKTFDDEPGCERPYAVVEFGDGTVHEVRASEIKFTDRP